MAQTTNFYGFVSGSPAMYYNATGGSTGSDASGELIAVTTPDNERAIGASHTIDGAMSVLAAGKIQPGDMTLRGIYSPASGGNLWAALNSAYENGTPLYFFWYPAGSLAGRQKLASGNNASGGSAANGGCFVKKRPVPIVDAEQAEVFKYEVTVYCPGFTGSIL